MSLFVCVLCFGGSFEYVPVGRVAVLIGGLNFSSLFPGPRGFQFPGFVASHEPSPTTQKGRVWEKVASIGANKRSNSGSNSSNLRHNRPEEQHEQQQQRPQSLCLFFFSHRAITAPHSTQLHRTLTEYPHSTHPSLSLSLLHHAATRAYGAASQAARSSVRRRRA